MVATVLLRGMLSRSGGGRLARINLAFGFPLGANDGLEEAEEETSPSRLVVSRES